MLKHIISAHFTGDPWFFFQPFLAASKDLNDNEEALLSQCQSHNDSRNIHPLLVRGEDV